MHKQKLFVILNYWFTIGYSWLATKVMIILGLVFPKHNTSFVNRKLFLVNASLIEKDLGNQKP